MVPVIPFCYLGEVLSDRQRLADLDKLRVSSISPHRNGHIYYGEQSSLWFTSILHLATEPLDEALIRILTHGNIKYVFEPDSRLHIF